MEPGDYSTNVLSCNTFSQIQYEYYEYQISSCTARQNLLKVEADWRQNGSLAHCDSFRDGIWVFRTVAINANNIVDPETSPVEIKGLDLSLKQKGLYEPAVFTRSKYNTLSSLSNLSATSMASSPTSSMESTFRSSSDSGMRRSQIGGPTYGAAVESPIPSPGHRSAVAGGDAFPSMKDVHESFVSAVLGSIVYFLCHDHRFTPLNSRTLILTSPNTSDSEASPKSSMSEFNAINLATLDISLTSLGALLVKVCSDTAPGLRSLVSPTDFLFSSSCPPGTALWLAPGGNAAQFYGIREEQNFPGNLPISQLQKSPSDSRQYEFKGITIQSWQSRCLDWFSAKGMNTTALEDGGWIFVQIFAGSDSPHLEADYRGAPVLADLTIVPWPARLCFQKSDITFADTKSTPANDTSRDPLSFAEEWTTGQDERGSISFKRQRDRQAAETKLKEQADVEARNLQSIIHSPADLRRGSNAGAMYPTPPDALHHPLGLTPSFDGQVSTPGNALFPHDAEATPQGVTSGAADVDSDTWGSSGRKARTNSTMTFNNNDKDNDLFGDAAGDLFGDITDADFSFFDEPDAPGNDQVSSTAITASQGQVVDSAEGHIIETGIEVLPETKEAELEDTLMADEDIPRPAKVTDMKPPSLPIEHKAAVNRSEELLSETTPVASPPFNKEAIFDRLLTRSRKQQPRRASIFNRVDFEPSILSVNDKYGANGRFNFSEKNDTAQPSLPLSFPTTSLLSRQLELKNGQGVACSQLGSCNALEFGSVNDGVLCRVLDSELASQVSEPDDTSHTPEDRGLQLNPGIKRKWTVDNRAGDDMSLSFNALAVEYEQSVGTPLSGSGSRLPILDGDDSANWSLTPYLTSPEPDVLATVLSDSEYVATAQILADQAASGLLRLPESAPTISTACQGSHRRSSNTKELLQAVTKASKSCLKDLTPCNLQSVLEAQGIPVLNQGLRLPPRPAAKEGTPDSSRPNNPFSLQPPRLEVRRSDSTLSVLPSATGFWENLGLGPSKGNKDVNAICVYPDFEGVVDNAKSFLDQMQNVYESFRFGSHEELYLKEVPGSLLPYSIDVALPENLSGLKQMPSELAVLKDAMARLSRAISSLPLKGKNILVYFIYPTDNAAMVVHICTAFQHLFNLYRRAIPEKKILVPNELVLQLVPLDFVASSVSIIVPLPSEYARLAMEAYDRCTHFSTASTAPAILLEQPLPKSIDFKMTPTPSASVLQENSCLHIAYAQSIDDRWITAAWTDNRGTQQMTASYCLGRKNEPISMPFSDVAHEIWETTMGIVSAKKIHWRVMITRVGVMDPSEVDFWVGLQSTESEAQISLTLITVQTDPSLRLLPPSLTLSQSSNVSHSVVTPVSTPQALQSIVSPDNATPPANNAGNAATPGESAEPDADARLLDYTDQSWGAVLAHRLNNSNSLLEDNPALISGYLLKRGGTNLDDPPIVMEVNIIFSEVAGNPRTFHEALLREILGYYRGLGTLARVRGVVDPVRNVRPWHVAAAEKAVKALYTLM